MSEDDRRERTLRVGIVALFVLSRLLFALFGIAPDPEWLLNHMQHADLRWLADNPLSTVWFMHSQPPLWNLILAFGSVLFDADATRIASLMHWFHGGLTLAAMFCLDAVLARLAVARWLRWGSAALLAFSPSVLFFENYTFYQHLTFFLVSLFLWAWLAYGQDGAPRHAWAALLAMALLAWTWSVFHPGLIVIVAIATGWFLDAPKRRQLRWPVLAALALALLPTVKNAAVFGTPATSSWLGMNLSQRIDWLPSEQLAACQFHQAIEHARATTPAAEGWTGPRAPVLLQADKPNGYKNFNHFSVIGYSRRCIEKAARMIADSPTQYLKSSLWAAVRSHSIPSYIYGFDPLNWERLSLFTAPYEQSRSPIKYLNLLYFLAVWAGSVVLVWRSPQRGFFVASLGIMCVFSLLTHALNGLEQHRMRYSIMPIYLVTTVALIDLAGGWWARRRSRARRN